MLLPGDAGVDLRSNSPTTAGRRGHCSRVIADRLRDRVLVLHHEDRRRARASSTFGAVREALLHPAAIVGYFLSWSVGPMGLGDDVRGAAARVPTVACG